MLPRDETCWLAADLDGRAAMLDALAYLKAARAVGVPAALEVSRSGVGAHVWVFFTDPVPAASARAVGHQKTQVVPGDVVDGRLLGRLRPDPQDRHGRRRDRATGQVNSGARRPEDAGRSMACNRSRRSLA
jgi:hypothetical protein